MPFKIIPGRPMMKPPTALIPDHNIPINLYIPTAISAGIPTMSMKIPITAYISPLRIIFPIPLIALQIIPGIFLITPQIILGIFSKISPMPLNNSENFSSPFIILAMLLINLARTIIGVNIIFMANPISLNTVTKGQSTTFKTQPTIFPKNPNTQAIPSMTAMNMPPDFSPLLNSDVIAPKTSFIESQIDIKGSMILENIPLMLVHTAWNGFKIALVKSITPFITPPMTAAIPLSAHIKGVKAILTTQPTNLKTQPIVLPRSRNAPTTHSVTSPIFERTDSPSLAIPNVDAIDEPMLIINSPNSINGDNAIFTIDQMPLNTSVINTAIPLIIPQRT